MNIANYKTEYEIQKTALEVLHSSLGIAGLIRFMQQFDKGYGDYTKDRHKWQQKYTVDDIYNAIKTDAI